MAAPLNHRQECCDGTVVLPPYPHANLLLRNPVDKEKNNAPDYRVFAGTAEIGAA
jgi:hypothetical protein